MLPFLACISLLALAINSDAATASCAAMSPPPIQTDCCTPMQIVFVMDSSDSVAQADLKSAYSFAKQFRCSFPGSTTNLQLGMVSFNQNVNLVAQLKMYTEQQWYDQVDTVLNSNGNIPQSAYTPMAEAFQLTREVFANATAATVNPNCTAKQIQVQRLAIFFTDGNPSQNTQTATVSGFSAFPAAWRVAGQDSAVYSEVTVPAQAKLLKALGVRVIFLGLSVVTNLSMHPEYFAGELVTSRTCGSVKTARGFGANFCTNKVGSSLAVQHNNSQCYNKRDTATGTYMNGATSDGWVCKYRNPDSNDFPIASPGDVYVFTPPTGSPTYNLAQELLNKVVPEICPNTCFLA